MPVSDPPTIRVAAYCRVSTDHEDQRNSLANQKRYFTDYIREHPDWSLVQIYFDEGISGTQTQTRNGFNAMISAAQKKEIDLILTKEVSRFARNTVDTLTYTRQLKSFGVGVLFTIDHIDTRECDGELRLTLMAGLAQEESRKTSERVKWGQTRRMEQGIVFGRDLLGFRVKDGTLSVIEDEAAIVRRIFHEYTDQHQSTRAIANKLTEDHIPAKYSNHWSSSVIYRILRNEKYAGDLCQKKSITPDYLTHRKARNPDSASMIYIRDHHVPIIDRILWERTMNEITRRSRRTNPHSHYSRRYWCSGLIRCGLCSKRFVARTRTRSDHTVYLAWRCSASAASGRQKHSAGNTITGCNNISINDTSLQACIRYVLDDMQIPQPDTDNLRNLVEEIHIFPDHILQIQLKDVPWAYRLMIHTSGRLNTYSTDILRCDRIKCLH